MSPTSNQLVSKAPSSILRFSGHNHFRQRLILATISSKTVRIEHIRSGDNNPLDEHTPGLADYEISFLRLLDKITNGSVIEISHTGTSVVYRPGVIIGGTIEHDCPNSRAIGYFLEGIVALAPFAKSNLNCLFKGITNDNVDPSVDTLRTVLLPQLKRYGISDGLELKILSRGARPNGGGSISFTCPTIRALKPVQFVDSGSISKIRGIAYATRVAPAMANRMGIASRELLTRYIPDVYIYTDVYKGAESGKSPGYGLTLVAESTTGALISAECFLQPRNKPALDNDGMEIEGAAQQSTVIRTTTSPETLLVNDYAFPTPEDLGVRAARLLLTEIKKGGCVDSVTQWLSVLFSALGPEDVSKFRIGSLSPFTVQYLRDIKSFLGVTFVVKPDLESHTVVLSCLGTGYVNVSRKVT